MREIAEVLSRRFFFCKVVLLPGDSGADLSEIVGGLDKFSLSAGDISILTSGTSGQPKAVSISAASLFDSTSPNHDCRTWGLTYDPQRMAGLQVIAQALSSRARLAFSPHRISPARTLASFAELGVEGISGTPSFFRLGMGSVERLAGTLRYLTLGGEIADQRLLSQLTQKLPNAEIRHIYATSETGSVFSVADGLEGFPESLVGRVLRNGKRVKIESDQIVVEIVDHEKQVINRVATGDLVKKVGKRWLFSGRTDEQVNVGGVKVNPFEVERMALEHEGVLDARAFSISSSILGKALALEVVLDPTCDVTQIRQLLRTLPRELQPVRIDSVESIKISQSSKKIRV